MNLVIDANIIKGYFEEDVLDLPPSLTASVKPLMARLGLEDFTFLDEGDQILEEWHRVVEPEWLNEWVTDLLKNDAARLVPAKSDVQLTKGLRQLGFPAGRDVWYIRTAKGVAKIAKYLTKDKKSPLVFIISEDIDFYEPAEKNKASGDTRLDILYGADTSTIGRYLLKKERIAVRCVKTYLSDEIS